MGSPGNGKKCGSHISTRVKLSLDQRGNTNWQLLGPEASLAPTEHIQRLSPVVSWAQGGSATTGAERRGQGWEGHRPSSREAGPWLRG